MEIKFPRVFGFLCLVSIGAGHGLFWGDSLYWVDASGICTSNAIESLLGPSQLAILYLSTLSRLGCEYAYPKLRTGNKKQGID